MSSPAPSNEIRITRVYEAPVQVVWDAWTDPEQVAQWWGPRGFTLTTHSKELRPGGIWHYTMHGPDGTDYPNKTLYLEVEELQRLVYDHGANDERAPLFRVTVLFAQTGDKTVMEMSMKLPTPEQAEATRQMIRQAGGNSTWDRLAEYLDKQLSGREIFVINRSFEAAPDLVFGMWTNPEQIARWLPPTGFDMTFLEADIRTGGSSFWRMSNHTDTTLHGRMDYLEVDPPRRLVYSQRFCTADGGPGHHPHLPVWPVTMHTTVTMTAEESGGTRVTVTWKPCQEATPQELQAFIDLRTSMTGGWTRSFDTLETLLVDGLRA